MTVLSGSGRALLVMDFQVDIVQRVVPDSERPRLLEATAGLIDWARTIDVPVIHVGVAFRRGYPEVSAWNRASAEIQRMGRLQADADSTRFHPAVEPRGDEVIITKRRVNAFFSTDLQSVLAASGVRSLVLAGIATSGVVLSTLRYAADLDYELTVASDACGDSDCEVHDLLCRKVFTKQADVLTVEGIHGHS